MDYLSKAPENVRSIVLSLSESEEINKQIKKGIYERKIKDIDSSQDNGIINEELELNDENPYVNCDFSKRLYVKKLIIYQSETNQCPKHNLEMQTLQVMAECNGGGKYGALLNACDQCKRLYTTKMHYSELHDAMEKNGVDFVWNEDGENEEG